MELDLIPHRNGQRVDQCSGDRFWKSFRQRDVSRVMVVLTRQEVQGPRALRRNSTSLPIQLRQP